MTIAERPSFINLPEAVSYLNEPTMAELIADTDPVKERIKCYGRALACMIDDSKFNPDLVIGIAKGGVPYAEAIADLLTVPMLKLPVTKNGSGRPMDPQGLHLSYHDLKTKRILLVDDYTKDGATIYKSKGYFQSYGYRSETGDPRIRAAAVFNFDRGLDGLVDYTLFKNRWSVQEATNPIFPSFSPLEK